MKPSLLTILIVAVILAFGLGWFLRPALMPASPRPMVTLNSTAGVLPNQPPNPALIPNPDLPLTPSLFATLKVKTITKDALTGAIVKTTNPLLPPLNATTIGWTELTARFSPTTLPRVTAVTLATDPTIKAPQVPSFNPFTQQQPATLADVRPGATVIASLAVDPGQPGVYTVVALDIVANPEAL